MNKSIWIINQYTGSPYHGMNFRSYYLAKEFIRKGYKVKIFSGSYSHLFNKYPKTNGLFTEENIDGIDYIWVKTPKYKSSKSIGRIINMLVFMINLFFFNIFKYDKPDKIIISSLSLFPVINAYLWSICLKRDFIFEVRDIWPLTLMELGKVSKNNLLVVILHWFEKFGYKKAQYVVSVLNKSYLHFEKYGMDSEKFRYIPNGISLSDVENKKELDHKLSSVIPNNKFIVGYLGTVGIANALDYLLNAAETLKENSSILFLIVGNGGEIEKLKKVSVEKNITNIIFIEAIQKNQVQSMLDIFDICYIGWHKKNIYRFGISANKIFDYMYSGKPILHSISIKNDIVTESNCGIRVDAECVESITNAILKFSSMDKMKLEQLGKNGKEYVVKNHTYESIANQYMELF